MGEVGRLDLGLMMSYRAAEPSKQKDFMLSQLLRQNRGLVVTLVNQLRGKRTNVRRGRRGGGGGVYGAWLLDDTDSDQAGYIAFAKAMESFDPSRGPISVYLRNKIYYELQNMVEDQSIAHVGRISKTNPPPRTSYFETDRAMDLTLRRRAELDGAGDEEEEEAEELPELAEVVHRDVKPPNRRDTRTALEVLLEDHCRFVPPARTPWTALRGRFVGLALERGELALDRELATALERRGVRRTTVRVSWSPAPVRGFAGVRLQGDIPAVATAS